MESQQYHNHMASGNPFLFQSNRVVKLLLLNIVFLLFPLFSREVLQDDLNVTVCQRPSQPVCCLYQSVAPLRAFSQFFGGCSALQALFPNIMLLLHTAAVW